MNNPMESAILVSRINMELRDNGSLTLEDVCACHGWEKDALIQQLASAGFEYSEHYRKFW